MWDSVIVLCFVVRYCFHSSFAIISMAGGGGGGRAGCIALSSWCVVNCCVALPHGATGFHLQFANLLLHDHTHLLCLICGM